jgi:hypothetical protein
MRTVGDCVRYLLDAKPQEDGRHFPDAPTWPPDMFAVAATLVDRSGCYAYIGVPELDPLDTNKKLGTSWIKVFQNQARLRLPGRIKQYWRTLKLARDEPLSPDFLGTTKANRRRLPDQKAPALTDWHKAALALMAISDEAASGVGFMPDLKSGYTPASLVYFDYRLRKSGVSKRKPLFQFPSSICAQVDRNKVCVQPKSCTPEIGCNLRTLSHHLALLPSKGTVETEWAISPDTASVVGPLRLLLVPFPFSLSAQSFEAQPPTGAVSSGEVERDGYFQIAPSWLPKKTWRGDGRGVAQPASDFVRMIEDLLEVAERDGWSIDGLVFPEIALSYMLAEAIAKRFAATSPTSPIRKLQFFISGTFDLELARNQASYFQLKSGALTASITQSKHHRWKLDKSQIQRYGLSHALNPKTNWWEAIDVSQRRLQLHVLREGTTMCALVCEDLARYDPVMPALTALGPNLLIALLMDGPQLERRWSGRHATSLADDPGTSVLTFTSQALVARASESSKSTSIAMWKQPGGPATELCLAPGGHALVIELDSDLCKQVTLDKRSDDCQTRILKLSECRSIRARKKHAAWLNLP